MFVLELNSQFSLETYVIHIRTVPNHHWNKAAYYNPYTQPERLYLCTILNLFREVLHWFSFERREFVFLNFFSLLLKLIFVKIVSSEERLWYGWLPASVCFWMLIKTFLVEDLDAHTTYLLFIITFFLWIPSINSPQVPGKKDCKHKTIDYSSFISKRFR